MKCPWLLILKQNRLEVLERKIDKQKNFVILLKKIHNLGFFFKDFYFFKRLFQGLEADP